MPHSGQNLRGHSFKGQNLEGANFSGADIRGADFTKANLMGANFTGVKAGLKLKWIFILLILSLVISSLSGFTSAIIFNFNIYFWFSRKLPAVVVISYSIIFISLVRGLLNNSFAPEAVTINVYISIGVILAVAFFGAPAAAVDEPEAKLGGMAITTFVGMASLIVFIFSQMGGLAQQILINKINIEDQQIIQNFAQGQWLGGVVGGIFGGFWGYFFSRSAIDGDPKFYWIWKMCVNFTARGATSFYKADLTDANFTRAIFKSADFKNAILTRTFWQESKCLELVHFKKSYIQNSQVRKLLVSGNGQEQIFDALNLKGINLSGANLVDASFVGANLSDANLQNTNLSRAKLKQTQLDGTDFTGATLTGAYIEGWGITNKTKFDGVRCEYVYMRLPTKENPDPIRKPDNNQEVFTDGEFGDFIKPIFDTLDLYHNQGVDPRAIAISFKQLAENHPEADLQIVGMEVRGEDKFLLRAKTAPEADKSQLSAEYFDTYNEIKGLPEREIRLLLSEKDNQIGRLENMVMTALERPSFYAGNYTNQGNTMSQSSKKESNFNLQNAQFGGGLVNADTVNAEQIGGDITNYGQQQQKEAQTETNNSAVKTILILASNPKNTSHLRLDEEIRGIDSGLQRAKKRELFDLKQRWAVRVQEVYQALLDFKPQIIHFSGHGAGEHGLVLEDDTGNLKLVDTEALAQLFELFSSTIECVVLNACYSEVQAGAIAKHIPYVIGMNQEIGDKAAIKFATGFYNALGTGESVEFAYKLGCNVIQLDGIPEHLTPVLKKKQ